MKYKRLALKISLLIVVLAVVILSAYFVNIVSVYKSAALQKLIQDANTLKGISIFLILCAIRPLFILLPASPLSLISGALYGKSLAVILVYAGYLISGTVGFFFSRFLAKDFVDKLTHKKLVKIKSKLEEHSWASIISLNFIGLSWDLVSITAGMSKIRFADFFLAISISAFIQSIMLVYIGSTIFAIRSINDLININMAIAAVITILAIFLPHYLKRKIKRNIN